MPNFEGLTKTTEPNFSGLTKPVEQQAQPAQPVESKPDFSGLTKNTNNEPQFEKILEMPKNEQTNGMMNYAEQNNPDLYEKVYKPLLLEPVKFSKDDVGSLKRAGAGIVDSGIFAGEKIGQFAGQALGGIPARNSIKEGFEKSRQAINNVTEAPKDFLLTDEEMKQIAPELTGDALEKERQESSLKMYKQFEMSRLQKGEDELMDKVSRTDITPQEVLADTARLGVQVGSLGVPAVNPFVGKGFWAGISNTLRFAGEGAVIGGAEGFTRELTKGGEIDDAFETGVIEAGLGGAIGAAIPMVGGLARFVKKNILPGNLKEKATERMIKAINPANVKGRDAMKLQEEYNTLNDLLLVDDKAQKGAVFNELLQNPTVNLEKKQKDLMERIYGDIITKVGESNARVNTAELADFYRERALRETTGVAGDNVIKELNARADFLEDLGDIPLTEAENLNQIWNAELRPKAGELAVNDQIARATTDAKRMLGEKMDTILEGTGDLKKQWGAVKATREDNLRRIMANLKKQDINLIQSLGGLSGFSDIIKGDFASGLTKLGVGEVLTALQGSDEQLAKAFNIMRKRSDVPGIKIPAAQKEKAVLKLDKLAEAKAQRVALEGLKKQFPNMKTTELRKEFLESGQSMQEFVASRASQAQTFNQINEARAAKLANKTPETPLTKEQSTKAVFDLQSGDAKIVSETPEKLSIKYEGDDKIYSMDNPTKQTPKEQEFSMAREFDDTGAPITKTKGEKSDALDTLIDNLNAPGLRKIDKPIPKGEAQSTVFDKAKKKVEVKKKK